MKFDPVEAHYRYSWVAYLRDGGLVRQFDSDGVERSAHSLNWSLVERVELIPEVPDRPIIEVFIDLDKGERGYKFWQVDAYDDGKGTQIVKEAVRLTTGDSKSVTILYRFEDNRIIVASNEDATGLLRS